MSARPEDEGTQLTAQDGDESRTGTQGTPEEGDSVDRDDATPAGDDPAILPGLVEFERRKELNPDDFE